MRISCCSVRCSGQQTVASLLLERSNSGASFSQVTLKLLQNCTKGSEGREGGGVDLHDALFPVEGGVQLLVVLQLELNLGHLGLACLHHHPPHVRLFPVRQQLGPHGRRTQGCACRCPDLHCGRGTCTGILTPICSWTSWPALWSRRLHPHIFTPLKEQHCLLELHLSGLPAPRAGPPAAPTSIMVGAPAHRLSMTGFRDHCMLDLLVNGLPAPRTVPAAALTCTVVKAPVCAPSLGEKN